MYSNLVEMSVRRQESVHKKNHTLPDCVENLTKSTIWEQHNHRQRWQLMLASENMFLENELLHDASLMEQLSCSTPALNCKKTKS